MGVTRNGEEMKQIIKVDEKEREFIHKVLSENPHSEDEMLMDENETFTKTADFGDGYEMDIKICGVEFLGPNECNMPYTEAVLFRNGAEVAYTDPDECFFGEWELEDGDRKFEVEVTWI